MSKKELNYSKAVEEIETIITELENDNVCVDQLTDKVKRVAFLIKYCKAKLHKTEEEVETILKDLNI